MESKYKQGQMNTATDIISEECARTQWSLSDEHNHVKQRSPAWLWLRESKMVTECTLHEAIGLRGLKEQTIHFDKNVNHKDAGETFANKGCALT